MVNIGNRIAELRRRKKWSQGELAKAVGASRDIIGKYERGENSPSLEMALRLAKAFDVPVDFLLGEGRHAAYDKETVRRIEQIQALDQGTRATLLTVIDTFLRDAQARQVYQQ
jgi:transcriptional regulator with XRE-family HTH domain